MNKLTKAAVLSAAVVLAGQAAHAQDLILGFTSPTATTDYTIDLGAISGFSSTGITDLSGLFSTTTYNSVFTGGGSQVINVGAAGGGGTGIGGNTTAGAGDFVDVTQLRTGSVAFGAQGSEATPGTASGPGGNGVTQSATQAKSITIGTPAASSGTSFTTAASGSAGTFANVDGNINPLSQFSGTIVEDLFVSTRLPNSGISHPSTAYSYAGSLEIDLSGATPVVEFIGKNFVASAVPEPATYGIIAGAGLLALSLRRQFRRSNA